MARRRRAHAHLDARREGRTELCDGGGGGADSSGSAAVQDSCRLSNAVKSRRAHLVTAAAASSSC